MGERPARLERGRSEFDGARPDLKANTARLAVAAEQRMSEQAVQLATVFGAMGAAKLLAGALVTILSTAGGRDLAVAYLDGLASSLEDAGDDTRH
jgi:hypothetical protein